MNHIPLLLHVYISGNLQIVWGTWKNKEPNNVKKKQNNNLNNLPLCSLINWNTKYM